MKTYKKFLDVLDKVMLTVATVLFIVIFAVSVTEIILRSFFNFSLLWSQDLCIMLTCWVMLMGCAVLMHRDDHLTVSFLVNAMPERTRLAVRLVTRIVLLAFCIVLGYNGLTVVKVKMGLYYTALRWPTGIAYMSLPVFGAASSLFLVDKIIDIVKQLKGERVEKA